MAEPVREVVARGEPAAAASNRLDPKVAAPARTPPVITAVSLGISGKNESTRKAMRRRRKMTRYVQSEPETASVSELNTIASSLNRLSGGSAALRSPARSPRRSTRARPRRRSARAAGAGGHAPAPTGRTVSRTASSPRSVGVSTVAAEPRHAGDDGADRVRRDLEADARPSARRPPFRRARAPA